MTANPVPPLPPEIRAPSPYQKSRIERGLDWLLRQAESVIDFFHRFFWMLLTSFSVDPFRLKRYGESLLTPAARLDLGVYTSVLLCVMIFEL